MRPEYFWWGGMWIFPVIMICIVAFFCYLILGRNNRVTNCSKQQNNSVQHDSAMDILKKRYARGEITKEEFEKIKKDIS